MYYGIQPGGLFGLTEELVILFDDGTYSNDIANIFSESVTYSKTVEPDSWGSWRFAANGTLEIREHDETDFDEIITGFSADPGSVDQRLNGCASAMFSSDGLGLGPFIGNVSQFCFLPDGRYAYSSTTFGSADEFTVGSSSETGGIYRIDGYVVEFRPYGGEARRAAFAFLTDDKDHISINGIRYMSEHPINASTDDLPFNGIQPDNENNSGNNPTPSSLKMHIVQNIPESICESQLFVDALKKQGYDITDTQELDGDVDCSYYELSECTVEKYGQNRQSGKSCAISYY